MVQVIVQHKVKSFDAWLPKFIAHGATREKFGCLGATAHRALADANDLWIVLDWTSAEDFQLFLERSDLREAMAAAGVIGQPTIQIVTDAVGPAGTPRRRDAEARNKRVVERYIKEVFGKGDLALADELFAADYANPTAPPGLPPGPDGIKALVGAFREAFPDAQVAIRDLVAENDVVTWHVEVTGTHTGPLMGMPPTGRKAAWRAISVDTLVDGKIARRMEVFDLHGLLQQLGATK